MNRGLSPLTANDNGMYVGAEPGVDPRRISAEATYGHMICPCRIEIVDYSAIRNTHRHMTKDEFIELMDTGSNEPPAKPVWAKVRWINICGLSWDVVKTVSIKYSTFSTVSWSIFNFDFFTKDLHPLALEDVFHGHARNRSTADYYIQHLFLRILCHQLVNFSEEDDSLSSYTAQPPSTSPEAMFSLEEERLKEVNHLNGERSSSSSNVQPLLPLNKADTYITMNNPAVPQSDFMRLLKKEGDVSLISTYYFLYLYLHAPDESGT